MNRWFSGRLLFAGAAVLVLVASVVFLWRWATGPKMEPTALQIMARISNQEAEIVVGANVQVSAANAALPHGESAVAADPANPARLLVAALQEPSDKTLAKVVAYRSDDGGANWRLDFDQQDDPRAFLADPSLAFGSDGKSHSLPLKEQMEFRPGNPVVLSDGALAAVYCLWAADSGVHPEIRVLLSEDGRQTARESTTVPTYWYDPRVSSSNKALVPMLAADAANPRYRDRLYVVWEDGSPRARILFAYSTDKGKSWVGPTILSEQPAAPNGERDYSAFMPSIAVNKDSVVAVTWYDRRGFPDDRRKPNPPGCNVRMRLSLDGGETWQHSVHINEEPIRASGEDAADKAAMVADASGVFHPVWIDDRTGTKQVWTTTVKVETN